MARDGSGNYSLPESSKSNGEVITAEMWNNNFSDIANALSASMVADGQRVATADQPLGGYKHTGVGNATARTHYAAAGQIQDEGLIWCGTAGGSSSALTLTPTPAITAYAAGQRFRFIGASFNAKDATLAVSGLTAKAIFFGGQSVEADRIWTGRLYEVVYDGTQFHLQPLSVDGPANKNWVINPQFDISQTGPSSSVSAASITYVSDQWIYAADGAATITHEVLAPGSGWFNYGRRHLRISTAGALGMLANINELALRPLAGRLVTLTISMKANASGVTCTPLISQIFGTGGSPSATVTTAFSECTLTTTWDRYRRTVFLPSISGKTLGSAGDEHLVLDLDFTGTNKTVDIEYVQLEPGPMYTPIAPRSIDEEMAICRRYWQQSYNHGVPPGTVTNDGALHTSASSTIITNPAIVRFDGSMRVEPSVSVYNTNTGYGSSLYDADAAAHRGVATVNITRDQFLFYAASNDLVPGNRMFMHWTANARF